MLQITDLTKQAQPGVIIVLNDISFRKLPTCKTHGDNNTKKSDDD